MSRKDVSKKQSKTQKVIVPKGTIDPSDNAIIEIPHSLHGQPIVIAKKIDSQKSCKSVTIDEEEDIIRRLSPSNSCSSPNSTSTCNTSSTSSKDTKLLNLDAAEMKERQLILKQLEEFHSARRKFLAESSSVTTRSNVSVGGLSSPAIPLPAPATKPTAKPAIRYNQPVVPEVKNVKPLTTSETELIPMIESSRAQRIREEQMMANEVIETVPSKRIVAQQEAQRPPCSSESDSNVVQLVTTAVGTSDDNIRSGQMPADETSCICPDPSGSQAKPTNASKWAPDQDRNKSGKPLYEPTSSNTDLPSCCRTKNPKTLPSSTRISPSPKTGVKENCSMTSLYEDHTNPDDSGSENSCKMCCKNASPTSKISGPKPVRPQVGFPKSPKCSTAGDKNPISSTKLPQHKPLPSSLPSCGRTSNPSSTRTSRSSKAADKDCCSLSSLFDDLTSTALLDSDSDEGKMSCSNLSLSPNFRSQANKCNRDIEKVKRQLAESRKTLEKVVAQVFKTMSNGSLCSSQKSKSSLPSCGSNSSYEAFPIRTAKRQNASDNRMSTGCGSKSVSPRPSKRNMYAPSLDYSRLSGCPISLKPSKTETKECCSKSRLTEKKTPINKKCSNLTVEAAVCPSEELLRSTAKELKKTLRKLSLDPNVIPMSCCSSMEEPVRDSSCNVSGSNVSQRSSKQSTGCAEGPTPEKYSFRNCAESTRLDDARGAPQRKSSLKLLKATAPANFKYCNDRSAQTMEEILIITNEVKDQPGCSLRGTDSTNTSYLMYMGEMSKSTSDASTETDVNVMLFTYKR